MSTLTNARPRLLGQRAAIADSIFRIARCGLLALPMLMGTGKDLEFSYITEADLESTDDGYLFIKTVRFYSDFDSSTIKLILDEGYFTDRERLFPKPSAITTDGHQITLIWEIANARSEDDLPIFARVMSPPPSKFIIYSFWISVFFLAALIVYWLGFRGKEKLEKSVHKKQKKTNKGRSEKFESIDRYLIESEKAVLNKLRGADRGELWQKQLQLATGFSKGQTQQGYKKSRVKKSCRKDFIWKHE